MQQKNRFSQFVNQTLSNLNLTLSIPVREQRLLNLSSFVDDYNNHQYQMKQKIALPNKTESFFVLLINYWFEKLENIIKFRQWMGPKITTITSTTVTATSPNILETSSIPIERSSINPVFTSTTEITISNDDNNNNNNDNNTTTNHNLTTVNSINTTIFNSTQRMATTAASNTVTIFDV